MAATREPRFGHAKSVGWGLVVCVDPTHLARASALELGEPGADGVGVVGVRPEAEVLLEGLHRARVLPLRLVDQAQAADRGGVRRIDRERGLETLLGLGEVALHE